MHAKPLTLNGKPAGNGRFPAICTPLVGRTRDELLVEAGAVAAKRPDILEWRVDFFEGIADTAAVIEVAAGIKRAAPGIPLLFTRRSTREGGNAIPIAEDEVVALYGAVCAAGQVDLIDFEMNNDPAHVSEVRQMSQQRGVQLILSFHDFDKTPAVDFLNECFAKAERLGADIAKVAVMPRSMEDVITLLAATLQSSKALRIPVVSMSMGEFGAVTRLCGGSFGSAMTFAVGQSSSAPGQMPIEDVEAGIAMLRRAFGEPPR